MKSEAFHVQFGTLQDLQKQAKSALKGTIVKENIGRSALFKDLNDFMTFMFPGKFIILMMIKATKPGSMYQLAQHVDRSQSGVLRECKDLEAMGFIKLKASSSPRKPFVPELAFNYDRIIVHTDKGECSHILPQTMAA
jgi:predicted transcriptional regulator